MAAKRSATRVGDAIAKLSNLDAGKVLRTQKFAVSSEASTALEAYGQKSPLARDYGEAFDRLP